MGARPAGCVYLTTHNSFGCFVEVSVGLRKCDSKIAHKTWKKIRECKEKPPTVQSSPCYS